MTAPAGLCEAAGIVGSEVRVEPLARHQHALAVDVLARAFRDNPLDLAVIGGSPAQRLRSVRTGMRVGLDASVGGSSLLGAFLRSSDCPVGVLLAIAPGHFPVTPPALFSHLRSLIGQGFRASARWGQVYRALEAVHPTEPHWYLSLLGVDPPHQGHGAGQALLSCWIQSVDRDRLPSYLETDREENLGFYARAGFSVCNEIRLFGTPVWCLDRPRMLQGAP